MKVMKKGRNRGARRGEIWLARFATGAFAAAFAGSAMAAPSQQAVGPRPDSHTSAKIYRVAGTVTNSVTGEVVPGATMALEEGEPRSIVQTVVTDSAGQFQLGPVAAAKYSLVVSRRGYRTSAFDAHDNYSSAIVTGPGQDTEHIQFRLNPGAMVRGVVTDDAGEPVAGATALLMLKTKTGGLGEHLVKAIEGETDDTGLFEIWNLIPGTYFLAIKATPWFAAHPSLAELDGAHSAEARREEETLDVAYPVTYYPGSTDEAGAVPISIASGDRVEASVQLHAVPALHLTVHTAADNGDKQRFPRTPVLNQTLFGNQEYSAFARVFPGTPGSGITELAGIAPGHYTLSQADLPQAMEIDSSGNQEVNLAAGFPTFSVSMHVRMADGSVPPDPLTLHLVSDDALMRNLSANVTEEAGARFDAVPPGKWIVYAESKDLWIAVISILTGGRPEEENRIVVKDKSVTVSAVLAEGKTNIEGFVQKDGKGEPGVMVVLVPNDPAASPELYRRDQSDSDGSFLLRNASPGQYRIVAIEDGWDLDWARPKVISHYLRAGTAIVVTGNSGKSIWLGAPITPQVK